MYYLLKLFILYGFVNIYESLFASPPFDRVRCQNLSETWNYNENVLCKFKYALLEISI